MNRVDDPFAWPLAEDQHWLRAFVRQLVTTSDVDDVLQSTWLAAVQRRSDERPLLATIARRAAALLHRSHRRRDERERAVAAANPTAPSTLALIERMEEVRRVATAVCELAEPYRGTLLRHHENGESIAAIASADGTTEAAVRKRLQRARELVLARLARRDRTPRADWLLLPCMPGTRRRAAWLLAASALTLVGAGTALSWTTASTPPAPARTAAAAVPAAGAPPAPAPGAKRTAVVDAVDPRPQEPASAPAASSTRTELVVHVRHADGAPAPHAVVRFGAEDRWADAAGTARLPLDRDPADRPDRISARLLPPSGAGPDAPIFVTVRDGVRSLPAAPGPVELELRFGAPLSTVRGRVVDAAGRPVARTTVFLAEAEPLDPDPASRSVYQPLEDLGTGMEGEAVLGEGVCNSAHFAHTDPDGAFVLTGLWPRAYVLRAVEWKSCR
ncbi:MAG: sigma-70 family RNA polymerase sigma factor, partial [Planctomycetes bacterium]|nr:sigma-70 family RNA polymerase sigma factor [Planctomycetota bacterium]